MIISYNDIIKRHIALTANADDFIDENCQLYYRQYVDNPSKDRFEKLINECGKSTKSANKYSSFIFNSYEKYNDDKMIDLIKENIGVRLSGSNYNTPHFLTEQVTQNKLCDRIFSNHSKITSKNSLIEEAFKSNADPLIIVENICSTVDKFNLSPVGKVSVSLDEMTLLSEMYSRDLNYKDMTREIVSYYMIKNNVGLERILEASKTDKNTLSNYVDYINTDVNPIDAFKGTNKDESTLNICINAMILGSSTAKFVFSLERILKLFEEVIVASDNAELVDSIINVHIDDIYNIFCKNYIDGNNFVNNLKTAIDSCISIIDSRIERFHHLCNNTMISDEVVRARLCKYVEALRKVQSKFISLNDSIYPDYNASILDNLYEGVTTSTIYADPRKNPGYWVLPQTAKALGIYYDDNDPRVNSNQIPKLKEKVNDKVNTVDKSVEEKLKGKAKREKILDKLIKLKHKIFKESDSIFDVVDINTHRFDCLVSVYEMENDEMINSAIMEACDSIIKDINRYELHECGLQTYFINKGCLLEFRLASEIKIDLSEEEINESLNYISGVDKYLIGKLNTLLEGDLQPLSTERISTLLNECAYNNIPITDTLELCKYAGVEKYMIECANFDNFSLKDQTEIYKYQQLDNINEADAMIAWGMINDIINEAKKDDDEEKPKKKLHISIEKIQLFLQAFKATAKNLSTKEQEICRQIDSTLSNFGKSVENAMKADNREQVIKGSVIPSFSKCIKIGIVAAGSLGIASLAGLSFAPAVPAIVVFGALASSKALMRGEQQALMDELEIELKIIERQIEQAEGSSNPKKMRALLRTQKELQRQYQRLRLGDKIGKNLRSSKTGIPQK